MNHALWVLLPVQQAEYDKFTKFLATFLSVTMKGGFFFFLLTHGNLPVLAVGLSFTVLQFQDHGLQSNQRHNGNLGWLIECQALWPKQTVTLVTIWCDYQPFTPVKTEHHPPHLINSEELALLRLKARVVSPDGDPLRSTSGSDYQLVAHRVSWDGACPYLLAFIRYWPIQIKLI